MRSWADNHPHHWAIPAFRRVLQLRSRLLGGIKGDLHLLFHEPPGVAPWLESVSKTTNRCAEDSTVLSGLAR
jgi:hypothetical protein